MKKTIGIYTSLYDFNPGYSLCSVIRDQLVAHVKRGYKPVLFVLESFHDDEMVPEGVEVRKVVPQLILERYRGFSIPDDMKEDVEKVINALKEYAMDIDIMITHDMVFIDTYLPYNIGLREAPIPCRFLHWIHSAPSPRPKPDLENNLHASRYNMPPRSKLVYLNHDKVIALAEMYNTLPRDIRVVPNSRDPRTFWNLDPFVSNLIDKYDLLSADIISVYPVSSTRMVNGGKQIDVVIKIHSALRKLGLKTKLIIPNAHANGQKEKDLIAERASMDVIFTSTEGEEFEQGVSSKIVSDLFRLSSVFIFPSVSENCSLILLEAMLSGCLLVLNKDCSGFQEFGSKNALYFKFGNEDFGITNKELALETEKYPLDIAKIIKSEWELNKPLQAKRRTLQKHNYDYIFDQIENLYYEYET
jgi:hypothetical protein